MIRKAAQLIMVAGITIFTPILVLAQDALDPAPAVDINALAATEAEIAAIESLSRQSMGGMVGLVIIILAALIFASLRERRRQDLLARFAEQGQAIPPEILPQPPTREREMRRGVWLLSLGLALGLVLYFVTGNLEVAVWSLILLFLGAASFINAAFFYPDSRSSR